MVNFVVYILFLFILCQKRGSIKQINPQLFYIFIIKWMSILIPFEVFVHFRYFVFNLLESQPHFLQVFASGIASFAICIISFNCYSSVLLSVLSFQFKLLEMINFHQQIINQSFVWLDLIV